VAAEFTGQQNKYFKWGGKIVSLYTTNFKLMIEINGSSVIKCGFFVNFVIILRGGHCDCSPRAPKKKTAYTSALIHYFITM